MKMLVAISNYGTANDRYRDRLLKEYLAMSFGTDIVLMAEKVKDIPAHPNISLITGLPSRDPWSLPFLHRPLFIERQDDYDLFVYSEDDTLLTEANVNAFLEAERLLPEGMIPGFLRYEEGPDGQRYCSTMHAFYHWDVGSVAEYGGKLFGYYTNEHGALYILTRGQLKKAIASGGYTVTPHAGMYDMLVSAATDPYTMCGLKKMICLSDIQNFMLHHLPNIYSINAGRSIQNILSYNDLKKQIRAMEKLWSEGRVSERLFPLPQNLPTREFNRVFHTKVKGGITALAGTPPKRILSIGCVDGKDERHLMDMGHSVRAVPADGIIAALASGKGVRLTSPNLDSALKELDGESFDLILLDNVLQYFQKPSELLLRLRESAGNDASAILVARNLKSVTMYRKRKVGAARRLLGDFSRSGICFTDLSVIRSWIKQSGMRIDSIVPVMGRKKRILNRLTLGMLMSFFADEFIVKAVPSK